MVTEARWRHAQQYEATFWLGGGFRAGEAESARLEWYGWRAGKLIERLDELGLSHLTTGRAAVLEVGSGPVGVASFFPGSRRVAVDPLADHYSTDPSLVECRAKNVEYRQAMGENLPFEHSSFDLAIIENCVDHVQDAPAVMRELHRTLRPDGIIWLTVNCRSAIGYRVHRFLSRARLDPGHTYTFTPDRIRRFVEQNGFEVLELYPLGSYREARKADWASGSLKARLKALLGVSEYAVGLLARRRSATSPV